MVAIEEIREMGKRLGVEGAIRLGRAELIRAIQIREGHRPCFGSQWCNPCQRDGCMWKEHCDAHTFGD